MQKHLESSPQKKARVQNNVQSGALGSKDDLADHELHNIPPLCLECAGPVGFMPDKFTPNMIYVF